jgi:RNA-binding protein
MLTGKHRRWLRAQAHHLNPVVQVGHDGLSESVVRQVDEALAAHELIKVRVSSDSDEGEGVDAVSAPLAVATRSEVVQVIGHVVVLFRRRAKRPKVKLTANPETSETSSRAPSKGHVPKSKGKKRLGRAAAAKRRSKHVKKTRGRGAKKSVR